MRPSGIITLTTDYGLDDPFVGILKGQILARFAAAQIVDLTHTLPAFEPAAAGFWLAHSFAQFPIGSIHVAVVDPGVGTARGIVAVIAAGHVLLAPDNGLLDRVMARDDVEAIIEVDLARLADRGIRARSATFDGRDIFAPMAAELAAGRCVISDLGSGVGPPGRLVARDADQGRIAVVDRFGNLISDIEVGAGQDRTGWKVEFLGRSLPLSRSYGDVARGELLALVNSFGLVELACNGGSAAALLGVGAGQPLRLARG